jgi:MurNAc alpha-1-phosphate uridylyltransferase
METKAEKSTPIPMTAMVLAAGLGLRMRPLTETTPKPLIDVAGRPLIAPILNALEEAGIKRVVVNMHHLADQIRAFASEIVSPQIMLSDEEDKLLDSGGGIKKALPILGSAPFFVLNADSFWIDGPRSNLARMAEAWQPDTMDILLLVVSGSQMTGYSGKGDFMMSPDALLSRRPEMMVAPFVYAGVAIIKPELFSETPEGPFSLNILFDRAIEANKLFGIRLDGEWLHVGTPDAIADAERRLMLSVL